ncbi:MAG: hypothetical protein QF645_02875 [Planctomycetota bacterium]|nr:hypothetical protein [Planctomycetota bacterium]
MLKLTLLLALVSSGDDLQDRLVARLQEMTAQARESALHVLEILPPEKRREAAQEFLEKGRDALEKRHRDGKCCPYLKEKFTKWRTRWMKSTMETLSREWKRMPQDQKQEVFRFMMEIYKGLPDDSKKALMKEVQSQMFRGFGSKKKK